MFSFLTEFKTAQTLAGQRFHVIFYAESAFYFQYYQHLFEALVTIPSIRILYITSDRNDAVLQDNRITAVYLKTTLAGVFPRLQADVMILTMPDLQNFIFKRSLSVRKYVYVFHALVSTHQQYRAHAFDHYDAIFCTGPQQQRETREAEAIYGLPQKDCVAYGYPLLETLREKVKNTRVDPEKIVVAPSWYPEGILNTCLLPLIAELSGPAGRTIWVRPHPEFVKRNKKIFAQLVKEAGRNKAVQFDTSPSIYTHLPDAGHLVTDRSGIALEYALASGRPVLFVDTPLKIQNPAVEKFTLEPMENSYRNRVGDSLLPAELDKTGDVLQTLKKGAADYRASIQAVEKSIVYPPSSWQNGPAYIRQHLTL